MPQSVSRTAEQWQKREFKFLQDQISKTSFQSGGAPDKSVMDTFKLMYWMFGQTAVNAMALVETASFTQYKSPIIVDLEYWIIAKNGDNQRIIVVPDIWCSCSSFASQVLQTCQTATCRHLLALKLLESLNVNINNNGELKITRCTDSHLEWMKHLIQGCEDTQQLREQLNNL